MKDTWNLDGIYRGFDDPAFAADMQAMHYVKNERQVKKGDVVKINMVRNGGYAAVLK